jgi:uridylate kinase
MENAKAELFIGVMEFNPFFSTDIVSTFRASTYLSDLIVLGSESKSKPPPNVFTVLSCIL